MSQERDDFDEPGRPSLLSAKDGLAVLAWGGLMLAGLVVVCSGFLWVVLHFP